MNKVEMKERPYLGPLGLDRLPIVNKRINFVITVMVGTVVAFYSWFARLFEGEVTYQWSPFAWPLIFLFAWPTCAVILWLRITGLQWRWSIFAGGLVLGLYSVIHAYVYRILIIIAG